jgi:adenylate cyclase
MSPPPMHRSLRRRGAAAAALALGRAMIATVAGLGTRLGFDLDIRIGVASGPVVGGVIGQRRFLFDLWGDTVNLASRLESSGLPGGIQISAATRELLGDDVEVERREIEVKGLGRLVAYLVGVRRTGFGDEP